ncbi:MAG: MBL fold metallo-hydrolase [Kofleriaceae bacterium]
MRVRFWGVRGSIPMPGPTTNRYGGNTSCVEVRPASGDPIIIDAGTGLRRLGKELAAGVFGDGGGTAHVLISHTHWDHIQGLPFFAPLYRAGNQVHVYARQRENQHLRTVFATQTDAPYFPVPLDALQASLEFRGLVEGEAFTIGAAQVRCTRLNHPWVAMAYRVDVDGAGVVYASDTAPFSDVLLEHDFIKTPPVVGAPLAPDGERQLQRMRASLVEMCRGADLLIYDTQFTPEEYRQRPHWGHSTPDDALAIARDAGVPRLCLYHHAPARTDDQLDAVLEACRAGVRAAGTGIEVLAAYEGLELVLGEDAP